MSTDSRLRKISNGLFDGHSLDLPPEGLSLSDCVLRNLAWTGCKTEAFFARGCIVECCDLRRATISGGYFGGGETAGFRQTMYRDTLFDEANLEGASFGSARFEQLFFPRRSPAKMAFLLRRIYR